MVRTRKGKERNLGSGPPERIYLDVGDRVADLGWLDLEDRPVRLGQPAYGGRTAVLFVTPSLGFEGAAAELARLARYHDELRALDTLVFAVTAAAVGENAAAAQRLGLPFPVLSDPTFASGRALGLAGPLAGPPGPAQGGPWCTLIVDPNQRIERRLGPWTPGSQAEAAIAHCRGRGATRTPTIAAAQAPALIVPNVLERAHCARLIRYWETGQRYEGGIASADYGANVPVRDLKVREDVAVPDLGPEAQEVFAFCRRRLTPEIKKAFNFRVTRAETLRIGCYEASQGGLFRRHRDDTTPYTAHRRFAASLFLNTGDYEGGYVRFPEYGPQLFSAETGGALVFSCSLLHEVTPVTAGRRFVLLAFFYGEAEEAIRQRLAAERRAAETGTPR